MRLSIENKGWTIYFDWVEDYPPDNQDQFDVHISVSPLIGGFGRYGYPMNVSSQMLCTQNFKKVLEFIMNTGDRLIEKYPKERPIEA